jgi:hypothetical protein
MDNNGFNRVNDLVGLAHETSYVEGVETCIGMTR